MRVLFSILSIIVLFSVSGCQQPQTPSDTEGLAHLSQDAADEPPVVTITGRYIFPMAVSGTTNLPLIIDLPAGRAVEFCWSVTSPCDDAQYRLGWDILDLNDDDAWQTPWLPFDTPEVCSTPRAFFFGTHAFAVEVVCANGLKTRAEFRLNIIPIFTAGAVDVMPYVCPNPLVARSRGLLHAVLMGTDDVDVSDVIPESIRLGAAQPIAVRVSDVLTPSSDEAECACSERTSDGRDDLTLTFRRSDLATTEPIRGFFLPGARREVVLFLRADMTDGETILASDCVLVPGPVTHPRRGHDRKGGLVTD